MVADLQTLTAPQRDALREVANIGAGHAATALSLMTGSKIMISVPEIFVVPFSELIPSIAGDHTPLAVVPMEMHGSLNGHTILIFPLYTAHRLAALMLRREPVTEDHLSAIESSAVAEAGNILAGAYMTALSEFLRMNLLPSPPKLTVGPARETLANLTASVSHDGAYVFCVETQFMLDHVGDRLPGYFLLLPDATSLGAMLAAVSVT
jgi:chemotaxis protein CheC